MNKCRCLLKYKKIQLRSIYSPISYFNFWDGQSADEIWFTDFVMGRGLLKEKTKLAFFSTLGNVDILKVDVLLHPFAKNRKRIFFTGENVHYDVFKDYSNNMLDYPSVDLSLGFDFVDGEHYLRFPIWLLEMFPPKSSLADIKQICQSLSCQKFDENRNRFCAMVSGTSTLFGTESLERRRRMVDFFDDISRVDCAGKFLRNTEELQSVYNDDKVEFLKRYKFFICPENTSVDGYVSEKVFHAIGSGCIPIYYGSKNNPEPDVLNHDAIIFWKENDSNEDALNKVSELHENKKLYKEFFEQPRLQPNAWEVVAEYFENLEKKINNLFDI